MNIKNLIESLENILYPMNEMSQAFGNKEEQVNAWVERPGTYPKSDRYFKYSDKASYDKAEKCCRISLDEPVVFYHTNRGKGPKLDWLLTEKEKRNLVDLLNSVYSKRYNITHWQQILFTFNADRFQMSIDEFLDNNWTDEQYPQAYRIDYPMPDYMRLQFNAKLCKNKIAKV